MKRLAWSPVILVVLVGLSGCAGQQARVMADCSPGYQHPGQDTSRCVVEASGHPQEPVVVQQQRLPKALMAACAHPHARVALRTLPIEVPATRCDLTGVEFTYLGLTVTMPARGSETQSAHADGLSGSQTTTMTATQQQGTASVTVEIVKN